MGAEALKGVGETAILELSLGCCAAVMYSTLGFNFKMRESEYGIAMAEGMSCYANYILEFQNVLLKNERILVDEFDLLRFIWVDPDMEEIAAKDFKLLLHLIDGAKDWLLSMPELSAGGFRAFLDEKLGQSFLVFPNGFAVLLAREADDCWFLDVAVYQNVDGTLRFGLASSELFKMVSEPVFEKVRDVDRKRICVVDSVAQDSDLSCFMGESQADGAYFSRSGGRDDPYVSFLAGDASLRCSHDVNS